MAKTATQAVAGLVAWVPVDGGTERDVAFASGRVPDRRALHYWDGRSTLAKAFRRTLGLKEDAWDVYLIYQPGIRWKTGEDPPAPSFWMHQLGSPEEPRAPAPYLDPRAFAERARALTSRRAAPTR